MAQTQRLTEYSDSRGVKLRVDRETSLIHGVKILGLQSKNGRTYTAEAVAQAAALYEGKSVNIDHPPKGKASEPRSYASRIGHLEGIEVRPDGLYGNLRFNPKHALAEQLAYDAEHAPHRVGLSHNVEGKTTTKNGKLVVEAITAVASVDVVADPATTNSLYEAEGDMPDDTAAPVAGGTDPVAAILDTIGDKIVEIAKSDADLTTKKAQIVDLLKKQDKIKAMLSDEKPPAAKSDDAPPADAPATEALKAKINTLTEQVATLTAVNAGNERARLVENKLASVPTHLQSPELRQILTEAKDEAAIDRLIATVNSAAKVGANPRPRSAGPYPIQESLTESVKDTKSFVHALTH